MVFRLVYDHHTRLSAYGIPIHCCSTDNGTGDKTPYSQQTMGCFHLDRARWGVRCHSEFDTYDLRGDRYWIDYWLMHGEWLSAEVINGKPNMIAPKATFLTLVACFTLSPATIAQPQLLQNYIDLSREFKTTAAAMLPAMPRVSDTNELWNRVNRAQDAVRNNSYGYSDILSVSNVCAEAQENTSLYVRYNVDPLLQDSTAELQQVEKQVTPQELSNMREFANELKVFMPAARSYKPTTVFLRFREPPITLVD